MRKPLTMWITTKCRKFWKRWEYLSPEKLVYRSRSNSSNWTWNNGFVSELGKEYYKAVYCHPTYVIYMPSTSCKMLGWMKLKVESRLPGEIIITSDMQMTPPLRQKVKSLLMKVREESEKAGLKLSIQKTIPVHFRKRSENSTFRKLQGIEDREAWCAVAHGVKKSQTLQSNWTTTCTLKLLNFLINSGGLCVCVYYVNI